MKWNIINTQDDVDKFNFIYDNFHDSCLKELYFSTGGYVSDNLSMNVESKPIARIVFQRQKKEPAVIEMEFTEIIQINIKPVKENEGVDIITTNLYLDNGIFFLSERDYEYSDYKKNERTWIAAKKVCWRERDDLLGDEMIYMEKL